MHTKSFGLIDKQYVHKCKEENVFIFDVRKMLPRRIDLKLFEECIVKTVSLEEYDYLRQFYVPYRDHGGKPCYVLRTSTIEVKKHIENFLESKQQPNSENWQYLYERSNHTSYIHAEDTGCIFHEEDSEVIETKILHMLGLQQLHINDLHRLRIYDLLKNIDGLTWKEDVFYSRMHVDTNHPFFFEHPNEHVPGMMLTEAIRQFGVACSHIFMHVPLSGVQFVLSDIQMSFNGYLELNFPIKFEGRLKRTKYNKSGCLTYVDFSTTVYQQNEPMVLSNFIGKYLPNELFHILRRNTQNHSRLDGFIPRQEASIICFLKNREDMHVEVDLINLSKDGFCIKSSDRSLDSGMIGLKITSPLGNIDANCDLIWQQELEGWVYADFKINYLAESDEERLCHVLKTLCFVNEERAIL